MLKKEKEIIISKKMRKIIQICRGDVCAFYVEEVKIMLMIDDNFYILRMPGRQLGECIYNNESESYGPASKTFYHNCSLI